METTVTTLYQLVPKFGYNGFGEFVFYRTYSRTKADGSKESWNDVVIRVTEGIFSIRKDWYLKNYIEWDESFWQHYALHFALSLFKMEWLPPGRGLWACGTEYVYKHGSMSLINCAFTTVGKDIGEACAWTMDCLMLGVGVGFTPERDNDLEVFLPKDTFLFEIPDSREGWVESVKILIDSFTSKGLSQPVFNYSKIRGPGLPIKGFGGISSGPAPLEQLHKEIEKFFFMYMEEDWYDSVILKMDLVNAIGACVVSGNVRRSAELACLSINDPVFMDLKNYDKYPHRESIGWLSNNSVILEESEDFEKLGEIANRVARNGEPGLQNRINMRKGRIGKNDNLPEDLAIGQNPCQSAWAKVLTPDGIREFKDIEVGSLIWSETGWTKVTNKWSTGINKVYEFRTTAGVFYGTENHKIVYENFKIPVKDSPCIDSLVGPYHAIVNIDPQTVLDGIVFGDGTTHNDSIILLDIGENDQDYFESEIKKYILQSYNKYSQYKVNTTIDYLPRTFNREIPERFIKGNYNVVASFLRGLYTANGSIAGNRVQLKASSFKVIEDVQLMLSSLGIRSYYTTNKPTLVNFKNGEYLCKQSYDLNISNDRDKFQQIIGFIQEYKNEALQLLINRLYKSEFGHRRQKLTYDIIEVNLISEEETFDITVDNSTHTYWTQGCNVSNCGEINLSSRETCCLSETCPTMCETPEQWLKAVEYATVYASTVTLLPTHQPSTNRVVCKNRRIGVSIIDITGWKHQIGTSQLIKYLRLGYNKIRKTNQWVNSEAGVPEAIRVSAVKPGGTVPKLPGKTSGLGHPTFSHTLRRVRVARNSPVCPLMDAAGVPSELDVNQPETTIIYEFPILQGPARPASEVGLWEQAMNLVLMQREWSDNAVSNTLYFVPKWELVKTVTDVKEGDNYYLIDDKYILSTDTDYKVTIENGEAKLFKFNKNHEEDLIEPVLSALAPLTKSVSLLPHTAKGVYKQMPEEGISKEEYERRLAQIKPIDWSTLRDSEIETDKYCEGESCLR